MSKELHKNREPLNWVEDLATAEAKRRAEICEKLRAEIRVLVKDYEARISALQAENQTLQQRLAISQALPNYAIPVGVPTLQESTPAKYDSELAELFTELISTKLELKQKDNDLARKDELLGRQEVVRSAILKSTGLDSEKSKNAEQVLGRWITGMLRK